jgi:hypothetical protein
MRTLARLAIPLAAGAGLALFPAGASAGASVAGHLIAGFRSGGPSDRQRAILAPVRARVERRLAHIRASVVAPRDSRTPKDALARALRPSTSALQSVH